MSISDIETIPTIVTSSGLSSISRSSPPTSPSDSPALKTVTRTTIIDFSPTSTIPTSSAPPQEISSPLPTPLSNGTDWYHQPWREQAAWMLWVYCITSLLVLFVLCTCGCLDKNLNLSFRGNRPRRLTPLERSRRFAEERQAARRNYTLNLAEHHRTMRSHYRNSSAATELGHGDEAEVAATREELATHGIQISEQHLREQREAYERARAGTQEIGQLGRSVTAWPDIDRPIEPMSQAEYEAGLARNREQMRQLQQRVHWHRRARSEGYREVEADASTEERERVAARVEANLRTYGLL